MVSEGIVMPNLSGWSAQSQTDTAHNFAVLHARFIPEYSIRRVVSKFV